MRDCPGGISNFVVFRSQPSATSTRGRFGGHGLIRYDASGREEQQLPACPPKVTAGMCRVQAAEDQGTATKSHSHATFRLTVHQCDEARPACCACARHGVHCEYKGTTTAAAETVSPNTTLSEHRHSSRASPSPAHPVGTFNVDDMALLHHWTRTASSSMVSSDAGTEVWRDVFPRIAFSHSFVLHAILGLSALHLAHLDVSSRLQRRHDAARHHNLALNGFRESLHSLTAEVADAVIACASINIVYVFGSFGPVGAEADDEPMSYDRRERTLGLEWMHMIRGVGAVLQPVYEHIRRGPLAPLLSIGNWFEIDLEFEPGRGDEHFRRLSKAWQGTGNAEVYDQTLQLLRRSWTYTTQATTPQSSDEFSLWGYNGRWAGPLIWMYFCSEDFLLLLRQRQPPALLLLAHVGVILHELRSCWFVGSWGRDIVRAVDEVLGEYWSPFLDWPSTVTSPEVGALGDGDASATVS